MTALNFDWTKFDAEREKTGRNDGIGDAAKPRLSEAQSKALGDYQMRAGSRGSIGFTSQEINGALRGAGQHSVELDERIAAIGNAIDSHALSSDTTLYRGVDAALVGAVRPGDVISDKAFSSFTTDANMGLRFPMDVRTGADPILELKAPAGTHAVAPGASGSGMSSEVLLQHGSSFRVDNIVPGDGTPTGRTIVKVSLA